MSDPQQPDRPTPTQVRVVAAVLHREGRYLLGRRPVEKRHGGLWEFPGGKLDAGESLLEAATRELDEELGLRVTGVGSVLLSVADGRSPFVIDFVEVFAVGTPAALEHEEIRWLLPSEMLALPLAPADAAFVRTLPGDPGHAHETT